MDEFIQDLTKTIKTASFIAITIVIAAAIIAIKQNIFIRRILVRCNIIAIMIMACSIVIIIAITKVKIASFYFKFSFNFVKGLADC